MAQVISKDGTRIAYDSVGTGSAVILIDPAGSFRGFGPMQSLAAALAPHFTVITYDRRGRGESTDTLPYAVEREVEDIAALVEAAGGSACLYGFSSGAVLALQAAAHGLSVPKLALLEPPLETDPEAPEDDGDLAREIAALVAEGRRGDAILAFNRGIGVPDEIAESFRQSPDWATMESIAHTLEYDLTITPSITAGDLASITTPVLVLYSEASDDRLKTWANGVANALPNARAAALPGDWHGVATEVLVPELVAFFGA